MDRPRVQGPMRRLALTSVLASLVTMTASAQTVDYFPDGIFGPRTHAFVEGWYSRHLAAMGEPSLYAMRGRDRRVVRFLLLPTWGRPVAIRVERDARGVTLTRTQLSGSGGYDPGQVAAQTTRTLRPEDWRAIEAALRDARFFDQPVRSDLGMDGTQWIVEVVDSDRYHVVDRWTEDGTPRDAALARVGALLTRLAAP